MLHVEMSEGPTRGLSVSAAARGARFLLLLRTFHRLCPRPLLAALPVRSSQPLGVVHLLPSAPRCEPLLRLRPVFRVVKKLIEARRKDPVPSIVEEELRVRAERRVSAEESPRLCGEPALEVRSGGAVKEAVTRVENHPRRRIQALVILREVEACRRGDGTVRRVGIPFPRGSVLMPRLMVAEAPGIQPPSRRAAVLR